MSPNSSQHTLVLFFYQKVGPSPVAHRLYAPSPCCTQMNPGVHIIALVLFRFVCKLTLSKILTIVVRNDCTHIGSFPDIRPSSAYNHMLCSPRRQPETVLILLGSTDLLKGRPDYCIHYDIKQCRGNRVFLRQPSPRAEGSTKLIP